MTAEPSPRPWRVNGHSIEANDPDGLWLQNEKTGWWVVANLPSCPKYRMSKKNRETWDAVVEANAALIVDAVNQIGNARGIAKTAVNEYAKICERYNRLLSAMKAIEDLCKVLDRTDLWEDREEWLDDAIYYIRKEARAAIKENEK